MYGVTACFTIVLGSRPWATLAARNLATRPGVPPLIAADKCMIIPVMRLLSELTGHFFLKRRPRGFGLLNQLLDVLGVIVNCSLVEISQLERTVLRPLLRLYSFEISMIME